ncbi:MAG: hypothetical protein ACK5LJ_15065 [Paracoccus sp. (in: a-proteobacteria)]
MTVQRGSGDAGGRAMIIGAALTGLWLAMLAVFWLTADPGASGVNRWISAVAALMPLGLIWMAVGLARAIDAMKAEADALRAMLDHNLLRNAPPGMGAQAQESPTPEPRDGAGPPPSSPAGAPAPAHSRPEVHSQTDPRQSSLGLDAPEPIELPAEIVISALNFPDGPGDLAAIAALREALQDPDLARLIRSAQDIVTLLAERGIFTDDLSPAPAVPLTWRRFAEGQRGQAVSAVGAIRDADLLDAAATAMRTDDVFRDAAHHFLRFFDRSITALMPALSDDEIVWLAETRSARAFMLLARSAGLFGQDS